MRAIITPDVLAHRKKVADDQREALIADLAKLVPDLHWFIRECEGDRILAEAQDAKHRPRWSAQELRIAIDKLRRDSKHRLEWEALPRHEQDRRLANDARFF